MGIYLVTANGFAAARDSVDDLTSFLDGQIVFTDSAGKQAIGYIKAADTAEHYE
jgi:hypothetical protein